MFTIISFKCRIYSYFVYILYYTSIDCLLPQTADCSRKLRFTTKKIVFCHESTQKHFIYIVEIRDIESLVKKSKKMTKIGVKSNGTVIF